MPFIWAEAEAEARRRRGGGGGGGEAAAAARCPRTAGENSSIFVAYLRIQGRMQIFRKMSQKVLNRMLTLPHYSTATII